MNGQIQQDRKNMLVCAIESQQEEKLDEGEVPYGVNNRFSVI